MSHICQLSINDFTVGLFKWKLCKSMIVHLVIIFLIPNVSLKITFFRLSLNYT